MIPVSASVAGSPNQSEKKRGKHVPTNVKKEPKSANHAAASHRTQEASSQKGSSTIAFTPSATLQGDLSNSAKTPPKATCTTMLLGCTSSAIFW